MGTEIEIDLGDENFRAELIDNETARAIADELPDQKEVKKNNGPADGLILP